MYYLGTSIIYFIVFCVCELQRELTLVKANKTGSAQDERSQLDVELFLVNLSLKGCG